MKKLQQMNYLFQDLFKVRNWFLIFPFAITGFIFAFYFYLFSLCDLLFTLLKNETFSLLQSDGDSSGVQIVRNLIGFSFAFAIGLVSVCFILCLAIFYFLTAISFYVSSLGRFKTNPFIFFENYQ